MVPPPDVLKAGNEVWGGWLVGFFLDKPLSYMIVINHLKKLSKLKGDVSIKSDGTLFLFHLSCAEDRRRIIEADPIFLRNNIFIIKAWDPFIGHGCSTIKSVPVWLKLTNIPLYAWSHLGINWLASRIGRLLCLDTSTDKLQRIGYAKCLVDVTPNQELVDEFPVKLIDGSTQMIQVSYLWKPEICSSCKVFGHMINECKREGEVNVRNKEEVDLGEKMNG